MNPTIHAQKCRILLFYIDHPIMAGFLAESKGYSHTRAFTAKNQAIEAGTLSKSSPLSGLLFSLLWMTLVKKRISCCCGLREIPRSKLMR